MEKKCWQNSRKIVFENDGAVLLPVHRAEREPGTILQKLQDSYRQAV